MRKPGEKAPHFSLKALDGAGMDLAGILSGGAAVLAFFKVSCPICQYTFPFLERLHAEGGGLRFFGVSQDGAAATELFLRDCGVTFPTLLDGHSDRYPASNGFGIRIVPSAFLVEPDGEISWTMESFDKQALEELGERAGASPFRDGEKIPPFRPG